MFEEDIETIIQKLTTLADEKTRYKAKIWTNAKGQASFEVRVLADTQEEIQTGCEQLITNLLKVCKDAKVPVAGMEVK